MKFLLVLALALLGTALTLVADGYLGINLSPGTATLHRVMYVAFGMALARLLVWSTREPRRQGEPSQCG